MARVIGTASFDVKYFEIVQKVLYLIVQKVLYLIVQEAQYLIVQEALSDARMALFPRVLNILGYTPGSSEEKNYLSIIRDYGKYYMFTMLTFKSLFRKFTSLRFERILSGF